MLAKSFSNTSKARVLSALLCVLSAIICEVIFKSYRGELFTLASYARIAITAVMLFTIHLFSTISFRRYQPKLRDLFTLHGVIIFSVILVWLTKVAATITANYLQQKDHPITLLKDISSESLMFVIPFAAGALLIQAVAGLQYGLVFTLSLTTILIIYPLGPVYIVPVCLLSCLVGCLSLAQVRSRSAYLRSGNIVAINTILLVLLTIPLYPPNSLTDAMLRIFSAAAAGLIASVIATGVTPILEYLSGYVTDMRLIEISTLDHPLLKRMSVQAPGTWNHSMVVGMMVEAAASEIGANPVLGRVGAYFHDIGKTNKPLYFIENQSGGPNRHEKLSPSMSALVIKSHVKEGIELAHEHKLPPAVIDLIAQHHGTALIEYFYDKARKENQESGLEEEIDRSAFTYSGPKPQTREAAILMLADGIESASRTLSDHSADRLQGLVSKMVNKIFTSGELNESDLTLRDLHIIAKTFTHVLTGIHHQRVSYDIELEGSSKSSATKINASKQSSNQTDKDEPIHNEELGNSQQNSKNNSQETKSEGIKRLGLGLEIGNNDNKENR